MTGLQKVEKIEAELDRGNVIYVSNYQRIWKITPKIHKKFKEQGHPVFKGVGNSVYMISGSKYLCCDGCKFTVEGGN